MPHVPCVWYSLAFPNPLEQSHSLTSNSKKIMDGLALSVVLLIIILLVVGKVQGRFLRLMNATEVLVSDGLNPVPVDSQPSPFLTLNGLLPSSSASETACEHFYGFFPCADNIGGYIFQIAVYEYLLAAGEKFLTQGSKQLFNIIGTGFFGDVFEILMVLPEIMVVLMSGLSENKDTAQSRVAVGVGMYAGSAVFCLTLQWGICVIFAKKEFTDRPTSPDSEPPITKRSSVKEKLSFLTESGVTIDQKTSYTAGILLLSLIPFIIVQLSNILSTSSGNRIVILTALVVSILGLVSYLMYQIFYPWIQERSLEYAKYENLLVGFLQHVHRNTQGKLVTDEGAPNIPVIKSLFARIDKDGNQAVSLSELESLVQDIKSGRTQFEKEYAVAEVMKAFDMDHDGNITEDEFIDGCKKWIHEAKQLAEDGSTHSRKSLRQVVQPWIEKRRQELAKIERLMSRILKHVQNQAIEAEGLLTDDGRPNVDGIKRLFEQFDSNKDKVISQSELKEVIHNVKFGNVQLDDEEVVDKVMKDFDEDGDQMISEQEFINGMKKWVNQATTVVDCKDTKRFIDEFDQITWKEVESIMNENSGIVHKLRLAWDCTKSALQVILGVAIVSSLAEPLMYSILDLSVSLGLGTFYISFVIIPFALKFKLAVSAIFPASQKSLRTASLTFSEIYGGVAMNNITGMSILLAVVYIKGLTWDYSVEVLATLMVCAVIGLLAFFRSSYPLWTCVLAFLLYPFSLFLVYFLHQVYGWD